MKTKQKYSQYKNTIDIKIQLLYKMYQFQNICTNVEIKKKQ